MASLDWLVKINDFLEGVPSSILKYFDMLTKSSETPTQSYVDVVCRRLAWRVNITVERVRQRVIKTLWNQYGKYLVMMKLVNTVQNVVRDPIGALGCFVDGFASPIKSVINFLKTLIKEVPRLAANLANIMSALPPDPPNPSINYNAFKLEIHTVTMQDVIAGPDGMPTPEQMFPEPPSPFSKAAFSASFTDAKEVKSSYGKIFKLPDSWKGGSKISSGTDGTSIA